MNCVANGIQITDGPPSKPIDEIIIHDPAPAVNADCDARKDKDKNLVYTPSRMSRPRLYDNTK